MYLGRRRVICLLLPRGRIWYESWLPCSWQITYFRWASHSLMLPNCVRFNKEGSASMLCVHLEGSEKTTRWKSSQWPLKQWMISRSFCLRSMGRNCKYDESMFAYDIRKMTVYTSRLPPATCSKTSLQGVCKNDENNRWCWCMTGFHNRSYEEWSGEVGRGSCVISLDYLRIS